MAREQVVEQIVERQRMVEEDGVDYNPMCIFAEGTTSNGTGLLKFKRGAFVGLRTIIPVFAKVNHRYLSPTFDIVEFWPLLI